MLDNHSSNYGGPIIELSDVEENKLHVTGKRTEFLQVFISSRISQKISDLKALKICFTERDILIIS